MVTSAAPVSGAPGPMEPSASFPLSSRDGTELFAELYETPQARGAALVLHGYFEHCGRYREVAHVLRQAGLSALAVDLRGHGRAAGQRGHALRFEDYLDDVDAALAAIDARLGGDLPLALVCHSHGGLIGLRLLADPFRRPRRLRCAVLSSPYCGLRMKVSPVKRLAARAIGRLLPTFSLPGGIQIEHLTHDEERLAARRVDTLCHDVAGARWFIEASAAQEWVREFAPRIDLPTLWVVAGDDHIADPAAARAVFDRAGGDKRWHLMEGMYHEVFNETDRGSVFNLVRAFLSENFPD